MKNLKFAMMMMAVLVIFSCGRKDLDIQQDFPFQITKLAPLPKELTKGQTIEIKFTIKPSGKFNKTQYYVRYFQTKGNGTLRLGNNVMSPNNQYQLKDPDVSISYFSKTLMKEEFDLWVTDNFGNEETLSFSFENTNNALM